ncbi:Alkylated dna repair protein alkb, partial [Globisporangium splendens]
MDFRRLMREERERVRKKHAAADPTSSSKESGEAAQPPKNSLAADVSTCTEATLREWTQRSDLDIDKFLVGDISRVYYIPEWISEDEEAAVLERVYAVPDDDERVWVKLKYRRLQMWGGEVKAPFHPLELPKWLQQITQSLVDTKIFREEHRPNHALINEYGVGEGIMPHEDGPSYFPLVAIISTGADCDVTFEPHRKLHHSSETDSIADDASASQKSKFSFQLKRRSLLLFTDDAYTKYLHSIDGIESGKRVSLTIRHSTAYDHYMMLRSIARVVAFFMRSRSKSVAPSLPPAALVESHERSTPNRVDITRILYPSAEALKTAGRLKAVREIVVASSSSLRLTDASASVAKTLGLVLRNALVSVTLAWCIMLCVSLGNIFSGESEETQSRESFRCAILLWSKFFSWLCVTISQFVPLLKYHFMSSPNNRPRFLFCWKKMAGVEGGLKWQNKRRPTCTAQFVRTFFEDIANILFCIVAALYAHGAMFITLTTQLDVILFTLGSFALKLCMQEFARRIVFKKQILHVGAMAAMVGIPTILIDTQMRVAMMRSQSAGMSLMGAFAMTFVEIMLRLFKAHLTTIQIRNCSATSYCEKTGDRQGPRAGGPRSKSLVNLLRAVKTRKMSFFGVSIRANIGESSATAIGRWRAQALLYHAAEVYIDMFAEYVALGCSYAILFLCWNHPKYKRTCTTSALLATVPQIHLLAVQFSLEIVVDYVSCVLETNHGIDLKPLHRHGLFLAVFLVWAGSPNDGTSTSVLLSLEPQNLKLELSLVSLEFTKRHSSERRGLPPQPDVEQQQILVNVHGDVHSVLFIFKHSEQLRQLPAQQHHQHELKPERTDERELRDAQRCLERDREQRDHAKRDDPSANRGRQSLVIARAVSALQQRHDGHAAREEPDVPRHQRCTIFTRLSLGHTQKHAQCNGERGHTHQGHENRRRRRLCRAVLVQDDAGDREVQQHRVRSLRLVAIEHVHLAPRDSEQTDYGQVRSHAREQEPSTVRLVVLLIAVVVQQQQRGDQRSGRELVLVAVHVAAALCVAARLLRDLVRKQLRALVH